MNTQEKLNAIRTQLKELGYSNRQISVQQKFAGFEEVIRIIFKFMPSDELFEQVKQLARKYKSVDYCERSGEILSGGNTFVDVSIDWRIK
ncbi:hypothetical protein CAPN002_26470 [Capnocytophaga stomatis]|uniref:hypothetical protein n=1 Tax=Capnocytophaga stomatis TaxID=1848904 RepID=UPI00195048A1|nr:hypothetical protein [Capnocytophaga stomatis]GIJ95429.1 hypothetical protein CAPN002_26470 [Capnocytophaga stomatis]